MCITLILFKQDNYTKYAKIIKDYLPAVAVTLVGAAGWALICTIANNNNKRREINIGLFIFPFTFAVSIQSPATKRLYNILYIYSLSNIKKKIKNEYL